MVIKKVKLILILMVVTFLLTGCGYESVIVNNPLNEKEIITYVQKQIYNETGDNVIAKITSKEDLYTCAYWLDDCIYHQKVDKGHSYILEITNKEDPNIVATGTYDDGYIIYDDTYIEGKSIREPSFENNYKKQKGLYLVKNEFINALQEKIDKYYLYKDGINDERYNIFINSSDYNDINDLLSNFNNTIIKYRDYVYTYYSVFIYKDETAFNNTNFELYNKDSKDYVDQSIHGKKMIEEYEGKEVTRIGISDEFTYDLFVSNGASIAETNDEYIDYTTFDYIVFCYDAQPNSFVGDNKPELQIFGVK